VGHLPDTDSGRLWTLLDEMWIRVRQILWSPASERMLSVHESPSLPSISRSSTISSMDAGEETIAVQFINKVRVEVHNLPGNVRQRKQLIDSVEKD
jgi:hypothetical protein